ncbi:ribonuclease-like protein P complex subunit Pop4 [Lophiotrema nucula]|uniref:Ribonuclease P protein subunit n=1 Tax=Lophiotrema nucula TaxID=690887 RepID=A0A6A5ZRR6_9PLEO|nr:ribonuclease-like protein P complex subunit Pop4 [Lophiotrema nucula]
MATNLTQELLNRAHSPATADQIHADRVVKRPFLVRPSSPKPSARALRRRARDAKHEAARKRKNLKPRPLSAAKKRALGLLEIPKEQQKYAIYEPLHSLWVGYMREILGVSGKEGEYTRRNEVTASNAGPILASADFHGCLLEVVRSRCVDRVGLKGIVVRDAKFVFEIITAKNQLKTVPKEHTVFRFEVPLPSKEGEEEPRPLSFEIVGEQFQNRAPDRATKKYKMHYQPDL